MERRRNFRSLHRILAGSVAFAMASAIGACSDDGSESGVGGAPPGAELYGNTDCGTCATTACATELGECQTDPGCVSYLDCLLACPVDDHGNALASCDEGCATSSSTETARLVTAVTGCRAYGPGASCTACAVPTSPVSDVLTQSCEPRPEPAPTACRQCYWDHCCDTWDACFAEGVNPDCDALADCIMCCGDPMEPCIATCFDEHPNSVETLLTQQVCGLSLCAADQVDCDASLRDACDECLYVDCGDSFLAMMANPHGYLTWMCLADCGVVEAGNACVEACIDAYPAGESDVMLWASCIDYRCGTIC